MMIKAMVTRISILMFLLLASYSFFAVNNCLDFAGSDDYVSIASTFGLGTNTLTAECWVNIPSTSEKGAFIKIGDSSDGYGVGVGGTSFDDLGNKLIYLHEALSWNSTGIDIGTGWHHVAFSIDASHDIILYLDGVEVYSFNEIPLTPSSATTIGSGGGTARVLTDGKIDEVRIWNDVRDEKEIRLCMNREIPVDGETNLVTYYKFNETSGTTADNAEGTATYDATLNNMEDNDWVTSSAHFGPKNCLDFDGSDDYVTCGSINLSGSALTLECWVKVDAFKTISPLISQLIGTESSGNSAFLRLGDADISANQVQFVLEISGQQKLTSTSFLESNRWYHIAGVYDNSGMKIYINGKLDSSNSQSGNFVSNDTFCIGDTGGSTDRRYIDGFMDEVRVWSDARTASEIRENMCKTLTGIEDDLLAYYTFDNTAGANLQSFAYNAGTFHDGTLTDMNDADWVASSAYNTWLNTSSSDWTAASNWSNGNRHIDDNVGIYGYAGGNTPVFSSFDEAGGDNYVINLSSDWSIPAGFGVQGSLILLSNVNLNGEGIFLLSSATLIEDSGIVFGTSGNIQTQRDLSNVSSEDVAGLGLVITENDDLGNTTISRKHATAGTQGIKRTYEITTTNSPSNATLEFTYLDSELNGINEANLALYISSDGESWTEQESAVLDAESNTLTLSGIDTFNWWTAGTSGAGVTLPVTLSSFTALETNSNFVQLDWITQSESNLAGYNVYRNTLEEITGSQLISPNIIPASNTPNGDSYRYTDREIVYKNTFYYWLESLDLGGETHLFGPISIYIEGNKGNNDIPVIPIQVGIQSIYPNPFNPSTDIRFYLEETAPVTVEIFNLQGRKIKDINAGEKLSGIYHTLKWDGKNSSNTEVASGVYLFKLTAGNLVQMSKATLMK